MDYETGKIVRVEYHLLFPIRLPPGMEIPEVGKRLEIFWDIPSHDLEGMIPIAARVLRKLTRMKDMDILSFCFGDSPQGDIMALRSYCGGSRSLMQSWGIIGV